MLKAIVFSIIVLGISSVIGQLIIIRELIISFYGNEFFIGWIFLSWLFWVGIGSLFLNKIFKKKISKILIICHILISIFLPLIIILSRVSRTLLAGPTGQIPNLFPSLLYSFIILAPLCLILGLQFAIINRFWKSIKRKIKLSKILGKTYALESLGFIIGGLLFSYILIFFNEFLSVSIIAWLNLVSAGFIIFLVKKSNLILKSLIIILIIIFIPISLFSKSINNQTNAWRFPNQQLIETKNSIYGNIAVTALSAVKAPLSGVTKTAAQYNFYESGLFLGADKNEIFNEYLAHFSLLYHSSPKKILLIGGGFNGLLGEILKHQPEKISYLELDPFLIEITKKYLSDDIRQDLEDERIEIINQDGRYFLKNNSEKFDVIILNLPNPSTALINRFYTQDFLKEIKSHLSSDGVLLSHLSSAPDYFGPEVENLDTSLFRPLKNLFNSVLILPEYNHLFIASDNELDYNPEILIKRLNQRGIKTNFVNETYIEYRLTNNRVQQLLSIIEKNQTAKINQDQLPITYYYNFAYWASVFCPKLAKFLLSLSKLKFIWIVIILLIFLVLSFLRRKWRNNTQNLLISTMAIAGFSLMAIELIIIFGFQIFYGYLYYKIALIITILMTGMAIGSWLGTKKIKKARIKTLIRIHGLIIVFCLILLLIFYLLFKTSPKPTAFIEIIFLLMAGLIGGIIGFEFPIVNRLYLKQTFLRPDGHRGSTRQAGIIYGADLLGSCLGAFLVSIFLVPIFGIYQTFILLGILNFLIIIFLFRLRSTG